MTSISIFRPVLKKQSFLSSSLLNVVNRVFTRTGITISEKQELARRYRRIVFFLCAGKPSKFDYEDFGAPARNYCSDLLSVGKWEKGREQIMLF